MSNPKKKTCPRCESDFECQVGSIEKCKCSSVFLSAPEQDYMVLHYEDCLCVSCMIEVQAEFSIENYNKQPELPLRH